VEAKKMELDRFVQAVRDPDVRESIYSRKLAPDFARQQKEIRHALQVTLLDDISNSRLPRKSFVILPLR
jgi:hypothetical protein